MIAVSGPIRIIGVLTNELRQYVPHFVSNRFG